MKKKRGMKSNVGLRVAGLTIAGKLCPKCKAKMFIKPCPCWLRRKKWRMCARCLRCGTQIGIKK